MSSGVVEFEEALEYATILADVKNMSEHWNGCVSPQEFIDKEWKLANAEPVFGLKRASNSAYKEGGNLRFWVLKDTGSGQVVAGCQTLQRPGFRSESGKDTAPSSVDCYTVGAVFTPEEHRGKGYAKRLISCVVERLDSSIASKGDYYTLYSAVGLFYDRFGFHAPNHKVYNYEFDAATAVEQGSSVSGVEFIKSKDTADELLKLDAIQLKQIMKLETAKDGHSRVALEPKIDTAQFWHHRALETARILGKDPNDLASYGAQKGSKFALWYEDFDHNGLILLRLASTTQEVETDKASSQSDYLSLLTAAINHASNLGLPSLSVWQEDLPPLALEAAVSSLKPRKVERQLALPMIRDAGNGTKGSSSIWDLDSRIAWY